MKATMEIIEKDVLPLPAALPFIKKKNMFFTWEYNKVTGCKQDILLHDIN